MKKFSALLLAALVFLLLLCAGCKKDPNAAFVGAWAVTGYDYVCSFDEDGTASIVDGQGNVLANGFYSAEGKEITVDMGGGFVSTGILGNDVITFTEDEISTEYHRVPEDTGMPRESPSPADTLPENATTPAESEQAP